MPKAKPTYREIERWSKANSPRGGARITNFFLHTQEGNGTAESLAGYLQNTANQVSYHYTVDNNGVVCDVVDTDYSSWSVLNANPSSINLCFAGSRAAWSRAQWLELMGRGIEIAAWLAVQDCRKYEIPTAVIAPPYRRGSGISDHNYVTQVLGMGTHTDVGAGFPWDVFAAHVRDFTTDHQEDNAVMDAQTAAGLALDQLAGPGTHVGEDFPGWPQLGDRTLVDAVAAIGEKLGVPGCYDPKAEK
ncbi:N-acetylmuramoyl-L-alanine amidase [Nocardia rhizosphaerae]|uniref:N-acetylmuramoyl-L-alanine amidase n=1 Tax=Nocardia rhizosphaerae TaxID=1691571 RepID=A0ABV8L261_9NOCA